MPAPDPKVTTSTRLFSEEVALADANDPESFLPPIVYEFAGGKVKFRDGLGPYAPPAE